MQQTNSDCALYVLKTIKCCIDKRNDLKSNYSNRNVIFGIRRWFTKKEATNLGVLIVDLLMDLSIELEAPEINNQVVAASSFYSEKAEILDNNNQAVRVMSQKETNNADKNDDLTINAPSRSFIFLDYDLPGNSSINSDLEF